MDKTYLGDAVYVEVTEQGLVLTTENGVEATNTIVLEPDVLDALERYIARRRAASATTFPKQYDLGSE